MDIRWAMPHDSSELSHLWFTCFEDDDTFRSWFFENRFWPEFCLTAREGEQIVGAMYGLPTHLWLREKVVSAVIIGGVSTHPGFRGRGIMRRLFTAFMQEMHCRKVPLTFLHPVHEELYFSLEHYTVSDRGFLTLHGDAARPPRPLRILSLELGSRTEELHACYQRYIHPYCGPVYRQREDFLFKESDYRAGGARLIAAVDAGQNIEGYCYYFKDDKSVMGEECVALSDRAFLHLAQELAHIADGLELTIKLPCDHLPQMDGAFAETKPWGCAGAAHLPTLLQTLGSAEGFSIKVTDPVIPGNNGVFDLKGEPTDKAPQVSLTAGRLTQWLCGYRSLSRLAAEGHASFHDAAAAAQLDALLPPRNCLCSEEY